MRQVYFPRRLRSASSNKYRKINKINPKLTKNRQATQMALEKDPLEALASLRGLSVWKRSCAATKRRYFLQNGKDFTSQR